MSVVVTEVGGQGILREVRDDVSGPLPEWTVLIATGRVSA